MLIIYSEIELPGCGLDTSAVIIQSQMALL